MIYTPVTKRAMKICFDAHRDQVDKGGVPYVFHPIHLAEQCYDEDTTVVALLHDVVEDGNYSLEDLSNAGFCGAVVYAVDMLTRRPGVPYEKYIDALRGNPVAAYVKVLDLMHNLNQDRLSRTTSADLSRHEKYISALCRLWSYVPPGTQRKLLMNTEQYSELNEKICRYD